MSFTREWRKTPGISILPEIFGLDKLTLPGDEQLSYFFSPGATNHHESSESSIRCCFNTNYLTCDYRTIVLTKYFFYKETMRNIWIRSNYFSRTCSVAHRENPSHLCCGIFKGADRPKASAPRSTLTKYHCFSMM